MLEIPSMRTALAAWLDAFTRKLPSFVTMSKVTSASFLPEFLVCLISVMSSTCTVSLHALTCRSSVSFFHHSSSWSTPPSPLKTAPKKPSSSGSSTFRNWNSIPLPAVELDTFRNLFFHEISPSTCSSKEAFMGTSTHGTDRIRVTALRTRDTATKFTSAWWAFPASPSSEPELDWVSVSPSLPEPSSESTEGEPPLESDSSDSEGVAARLRLPKLPGALGRLGRF
mmetsp:Transcript_2532/g.5685  ORF Transcript_2532/g.5685 Transcript_2532/m.5685 type:complete len:226 (+) Transcript_2532:158-835(+)